MYYGVIMSNREGTEKWEAKEHLAGSKVYPRRDPLGQGYQTSFPIVRKELDSYPVAEKASPLMGSKDRWLLYH